MSRFATYVEKTIVFIAGSRIHKRAWKHVSNYLVLHGECHSCHVATKFVRLHNYTVLPLRCRRQDGVGMQFLSPSVDVWAKQDAEVLLYDWLSRIIRQMWTIREFSEKPKNFSMVVMFLVAIIYSSRLQNPLYSYWGIQLLSTYFHRVSYRAVLHDQNWARYISRFIWV